MGERNVSHELLEQWLADKPSPALFTAWKDYIGAFAATLSHDDRRALKGELLEHARGVAEAAGGLLGFGNRIMSSEQRVLQELELPIPD